MQARTHHLFCFDNIENTEVKIGTKEEGREIWNNKKVGAAAEQISHNRFEQDNKTIEACTEENAIVLSGKSSSKKAKPDSFNGFATHPCD